MKSYFLLLITGLLAMAGCKKLDYGSPALKSATLTLQLDGPVSLKGIKAVCNTALNASDKNYTYGFCCALTHNPTIPGLATESLNYSGGSFSATINNTEYGNKYYIRAFVTNGLIVTYSNEDSFSVPDYLNTGIVKNITARSFDVAVTTLTTPGDTITQRGICYATKTNPTVDSFVRYSSSVNAGTVTLNVTDSLRPGVAYYVRSFVVAGGLLYYGNEVSFTATGYKGGTGGYVFFDKGDTTEGWRFLEAALDTLTVPNVSWGCANTAINGTSSLLGTGFENSNLIVAGCPDTLAAAAICRSLLLKTKRDWYLPSVDELKALYNCKVSKIITGHNFSLYTSTEASAANCNVIDFSTGLKTTLPKNSATAFIWPVRRF